jgi:uncharacterized protein YjgD (DUF1641 family)
MDDSTPGSPLTPLLDVLARLDGRLARIEQRIERLERLTQHTSALPNAAAIAVDSLDDAARRLQERGVDLEERVSALARLAEKLTAPHALEVAESLFEHLPSFDRLLSSGVLGAGPIDVIARAGQALGAAQRAVVRPIGAFGLWRALSDHHVQHALGFAIAFASAFGRGIEPTPAVRELPSDSLDSLS